VTAIGSWQGDRAERLQEKNDVDRVHVFAKHLVALGRPVHLFGQCGGLLRERREIRCWRESPGETLREGLTPAVEDPGEAVGVDGPGIPVVRESRFELDAAVHAWDITVALGQPGPLSDALAAQLLPAAHAVVEPLRQFGAYAPALPPQAGDDDAAELLRYLGRDPEWVTGAFPVE
jgi:hypothetical protein